MTAQTYHYGYEPGHPGSPLLVAFHGTGGNEQEMLRLGRQLMPQASVLAPRGDVSEGGALRFFRRTAEGVYDMDDLARRTAAMARFVRDQVEALRPSSVLGVGYSNGANILASLVFSAPEMFGAVALLHPLIPFEPKVAGDLAGLQVLITAGRRDPICPPNLTARLESHLRALRADVILDWHEGGHELRTSELTAARRLFSSVAEKADG